MKRFTERATRAWRGRVTIGSCASSGPTPAPERPVKNARGLRVLDEQVRSAGVPCRRYGDDISPVRSVGSAASRKHDAGRAFIYIVVPRCVTISTARGRVTSFGSVRYGPSMVADSAGWLVENARAIVGRGELASRSFGQLAGDTRSDARVRATNAARRTAQST